MQPVVECFSISNYYQGKTMFSSLSQLNMMADDSNKQKSPESGYEDKKKVIISTNLAVLLHMIILIIFQTYLLQFFSFATKTS
jgi:hypothetical protein